MNARSLLAGLLFIIPIVAFGDQGDLPTQTSGPYIGAGLGASQIDTRDGSTTVSGESFSYRLVGGYRFAHIPLPFGLNLDAGLEAGYADLGAVEERAAGADVEVEMTAFVTSGIVYLPIHNNWDLFGKVGVYFWDGTVTADGVETSSETNSDLSLGLGVGWQTGTSFGLTFEVESLDALDGVLIGTLSATYQFK